MVEYLARKLAEPSGPTEDLLPAGLWADLAEPGLSSDGPIWVALEDDYGLGAAVAAVARLPDGRLEVDGWLCPDWDPAIADVQIVGGARQIRQLLVGASLADRLPPGLATAVPAGGKQTRAGLALFRDLGVGRPARPRRRARARRRARGGEGQGGPVGVVSDRPRARRIWFGRRCGLLGRAQAGAGSLRSS